MKGHKDMVKIQTCVLRVSIHCEGCKHKVKKLLQKVQGVQKVNIDEEQGKVTVLGDVDPQILLNKLEKSGKHAELWESHNKAVVFNMNNQFSKFPVGNNKKDSFKAQKNNDKGSNPKSGFQAQQMNPEKGTKGLNFFAQMDNKKSVKFKLPEEAEREEDEESDFGSDEDDEFGSEKSDDGAVSSHKTLTKAASHGAAARMDESKNGIKKGNGIDKLIKAMLGKSIGKGSSEKKEKSKKKNGTDKTGKEKKGSAVVEVGEVETVKSGKIKIPQMPNPADVAKVTGSWKDKKKGSNFDGMPKPNLKQEHEINGQAGSNHNKNFDFMSQQGNFRGMPLPSYGPPGNGHNVPPHQFQGFDMGGNFNNHYNNPQYAQMMMMMMNQQRMNQNSYGPPMHHHHPMMGYGPPQMMAHDDRYTHMFNDENTGSCSIM